MKNFQTYSKWQNGLLKNTKLKCNEYQAVVFTPSAGLGDSANALSAAFLYTIRAGMMFFIDWTPFEAMGCLSFCPIISTVLLFYKYSVNIPDLSGRPPLPGLGSKSVIRE